MSDTTVMKTGTTTIGVVCKDGVVLAADKRVTVGGGTIIGGVQKVLPIGVTTTKIQHQLALYERTVILEICSRLHSYWPMIYFTFVILEIADYH